jgi:hypothetical protein
MSARGELYPRGMPPVTALRLALGTIAGTEMLREEDIRARVHGRFPEASLLPPRPELDLLLQEVNADRVWREPPGGEAGYYSPMVSDTTTGTIAINRHPTYAPAPEATPEVLDARAIEDKIVYAAERGIFVTVEPPHARAAEAEILRRFPREQVSLERLMLRAYAGRGGGEARSVAQSTRR